MPLLVCIEQNIDKGGSSLLSRAARPAVHVHVAFAAPAAPHIPLAPAAVPLVASAAPAAPLVASAAPAVPLVASAAPASPLVAPASAPLVASAAPAVPLVTSTTQPPAAWLIALHERRRPLVSATRAELAQLAWEVSSIGVAEITLQDEN